jgi:hypothetical protein
VRVVCTAFAAFLVMAGPAAAVPLDAGGARPPSRTPAPELPDPGCSESYADDAPRGGPRMRFGIGPRPAGDAGAGQSVPLVPEDADRRDAAVLALRGQPRTRFAVRLNRLFMSDGVAGIARFKRLARRFTRHGIEVELQVRYHPRPVDDGNLARWLAFVRRVVRAFGPNRLVTGLQITNEVNLTFSPNTSDGAYRRAPEALVKGVVEAKRTSRRLGYHQQQIGFNYVWRLAGPGDAAFWRRLGHLGGRRLRRHTDWVGLDIYPGTYAPGLLLPAPLVDAGDALLEGLAQTRECFMPLAGFGRHTPLRIEEMGVYTGSPPVGRSEAGQRRLLAELVRTANAYRGAYGLTDLRWFNLRDNNSAAPGWQSHSGLLRDDYTRKPAFAEYRRLIARWGRRGAAQSPR